MRLAQPAQLASGERDAAAAVWTAGKSEACERIACPAVLSNARYAGENAGQLPSAGDASPGALRVACRRLELAELEWWPQANPAACIHALAKQIKKKVNACTQHGHTCAFLDTHPASSHIARASCGSWAQVSRRVLPTKALLLL